MAVLNINTDAVVRHTARLERMHKSNLPIAVRNTLNSAAFDVKTNTMPASAKATFTERNKTFFKANSKVQTATGFNLKSMKATVGFFSNKLKGGNNFAVKDLEQQEKGGKIKGRSFIPTDQARGGNNSKMVKPSNRFSKISGVKFIDARKGRTKGKSPGDRFHRAAGKAGKGGTVLAPYKGKMMLWRVNSIRKTKSNQWKLTPLYSFEKNRAVKVSKTNFMKSASLKSAKKMERVFIKEAEKRFKKGRR